jgi:hypothetical protein
LKKKKRKERKEREISATRKNGWNESWQGVGGL